MSLFSEGMKFRRGTEEEAFIDSVVHGDGMFSEVHKDADGNVTEAHYLIPIREEGDE